MSIIFIILLSAVALLTLLAMAFGLNAIATSIYAAIIFASGVVGSIEFDWWGFPAFASATAGLLQLFPGQLSS